MSWSELLRQFLDEVTLMTDMEPDEKGVVDAIRLMTIHASKWLEFDNVYVVGVEENVFPMSRAKMDPDEMEEERRLMYVAVTRAKDTLFISYAASRLQWWQTSTNNPSRFVSEIPEDLIQQYQLGSWYRRRDDIHVWDHVRHKLFGTGEVIEVRDQVAVVNFDNQKFAYRKIPLTMLELE